MIGVVGDAATAQRVAQEIEAAGEEAMATSPDTLPQPEIEVVIAIGDTALPRIAEADADVPVLPVEPGRRSGTFDVQTALERIEQFRAGRAELRTEPLLAVTANEEPVGHSCLDVMLVRSEPGRISEYSWTAGQDREQFRADGVVVATPRGSHGYAHAAGGPCLGLDTATVLIVPVAAFGLGAAAWVQDSAGEIELRVERDEGAVSLLLDGHERRRFSGRSTVTVRRQGSLETIDPSA